MKTTAIHKLLDLAKRLPSIEILDTAELTPLLEVARAIKAAEAELKAACAFQGEDEGLLSAAEKWRYAQMRRAAACFQG